MHILVKNKSYGFWDFFFLIKKMIIFKKNQISRSKYIRWDMKYRFRKRHKILKQMVNLTYSSIFIFVSQFFHAFFHQIDKSNVSDLYQTFFWPLRNFYGIILVQFLECMCFNIFQMKFWDTLFLTCWLTSSAEAERSDSSHKGGP